MAKIKVFLMLLSVSLLLASSCKDTPNKVVDIVAVEFKKEGELVIYKADTDSVITRFNIEIADSDFETQTGLMYRDAMEQNQGMLFIFSEEAMHSFYMKNTKIPLDIIYIDKNLRIASFKENAQPLDEAGLSSEVPVQYVLEINAGLAEKWLLEVGDRISYEKN